MFLARSMHEQAIDIIMLKFWYIHKIDVRNLMCAHIIVQIFIHDIVLSIAICKTAQMVYRNTEFSKTVTARLQNFS
jgi:hypothetical protein